MLKTVKKTRKNFFITCVIELSHPPHVPKGYSTAVTAHREVEKVEKTFRYNRTNTFFSLLAFTPCSPWWATKKKSLCTSCSDDGVTTQMKVHTHVCYPFRRLFKSH